MQGDYNIVINDFEKAKSLFANTDVKVFKKGWLLTLYICELYVCPLSGIVCRKIQVCVSVCVCRCVPFVFVCADLYVSVCVCVCLRE